MRLAPFGHTIVLGLILVSCESDRFPSESKSNHKKCPEDTIWHGVDPLLAFISSDAANLILFDGKFIVNRTFDGSELTRIHLPIDTSRYFCKLVRGPKKAWALIVAEGAKDYEEAYSYLANDYFDIYFGTMDKPEKLIIKRYFVRYPKEIMLLDLYMTDFAIIGDSIYLQDLHGYSHVWKFNSDSAVNVSSIYESSVIVDTYTGVIYRAKNGLKNGRAIIYVNDLNDSHLFSIQSNWLDSVKGHLTILCASNHFAFVTSNWVTLYDFILPMDTPYLQFSSNMRPKFITNEGFYTYRIKSPYFLFNKYECM